MVVDWTCASTVPAVSCVMLVLALRAKILVHALYYGRAVLAQELSPPCRIIVFLVSFSV